MKIHAVDQRSEEWFAARRGKPSASQAHRLITPRDLKMSDSAPLYMAELIGEKIFGRSVGRDISNLPAVRHGRDTEPVAFAEAQQLLPGEVKPGSWCTDDSERYGCSPDGFVMGGNTAELLEIKCPYEMPNHICNLLYGTEGLVSGRGPGKDYKAQVQFQLLVTGFDAVNFMSFHRGCPTLMVRVGRDEKFIAALRTILEDFCVRLERDYQRALEMGAWG